MNSREIVLIDENLDEQSLTSSGIRKAEKPCRITSWRDGESAIARLLDSTKRLPVLVVLDYHLPNLSGVQVLTALRASPRTRYIPVVIFSIALTDAEIRECYDQRANCCMIKPVDPEKYVEDVALMVRHWLNVVDYAEPTPNRIEGARPLYHDVPFDDGQAHASFG